jgi:hypothetical protein
LNHVSNGLLPDALRFVDVLESVQLLRSLVFDDAHLQGQSSGAFRREDGRVYACLAESTLAYRSVEVEVVKSDFAVEVNRF